MVKNTSKTSKFSTKQLTIIGMLSAISMFLGLTGYGFIPLPMAKATILHIPVIIGSILEGPIIGAIVGLLFGIFSLFQNITNPSLLSFAFINPLVSILPRIIVGIIPYYCYKLFFKQNQLVKIGFSAAIGSLVNTLGVLFTIYLLYGERYAEVVGINPDAVVTAIAGIGLTNGIPEAIVSVVITVPLIKAIKRNIKS